MSFFRQALHTQWAKWGYSVAYEAFSCAPLAFLGVIPVTVLCYFRAMNNYWDRPAVAAFAAALGLFLFVTELVRYHEVIDGLGFPFQLDNGARLKDQDVWRVTPPDVYEYSSPMAQESMS